MVLSLPNKPKSLPNNKKIKNIKYSEPIYDMGTNVKERQHQDFATV